MSPEEFEALYVLLHRLEQRWVPALPDASVFFGYDPLPLQLFLNGVRVACEHARGRRFLDIGCGIGTKLAFMHALGWAVAGIDRHEPYIATARELIPDADLSVADLRELDHFEADIVYMYRPGVAEDLERELEEHVADRISAGTVLFLPTREIVRGDLLPCSAPHVWVKA